MIKETKNVTVLFYYESSFSCMPLWQPSYISSSFCSLTVLFSFLVYLVLPSTYDDYDHNYMMIIIIPIITTTITLLACFHFHCPTSLSSFSSSLSSSSSSCPSCSGDKEAGAIRQEMQGPVRALQTSARNIAKIFIDAKLECDEEEYVKSFNAGETMIG